LRLLALVGLVALAGCGFHLRGSNQAPMPAELAVLRVQVSGGASSYDPLLNAMHNALRTQGGVTIAERGDAPLLTLFGERVDTRVISADASGKAREYMLRYQVSFRLADAEGRVLLAPQTVVRQKSYTFDPLNVLAKEREERELRREVQQEAAEQIVRRLARFNPAAPQ
jgi:LPS-assembly lipoprotein